jgi:polar amino acid transport system substrate-binding protein
MQKRAMLLFSILFLGLSFLIISPVPAETKKIIVIENDWPPYYFGRNSFELPGFARELIDNCIGRTGYTADYRFYPVKRMYFYLEKGDIDIALFSYRKSREDLVFYGKEPLFSSGYRPVVRKYSGISIQSLKDFDPLRLGHLAGLRYSPEFFEYVRKRGEEGTLVTTTVENGSLRMLLKGMIDVFVDTRDSVIWRARRMGVTDKIEILDYDIKTSDYFVTISKNSPRIDHPRKVLDILDSCFEEMKTSGLYFEIAGKYGIQ